MREPAPNNRFRLRVRQLLDAVERSVAANRELEKAHVAFARAVAAPKLRLAPADGDRPDEEGGRDAS